MKTLQLLYRPVVYTILASFVVALTVNVVWSHKKASSVRAVQSNEKSIGKVTEQNEPVTIVAMSLNNRRIQFSEKFQGENDWLRSLELKVRNVSDKPVTYFLISLHFPETETTGPRMVMPISVGRYPKQKSPTNEPLFLIKGDDSTVKIDDVYISRINKLLESRGYTLSNLSKVNVVLTMVCFDDGYMWSGGGNWAPDPSHPTRYRRID